MAKASSLPLLERPENTEKILEKIANGSYDKDIYKAMKVSSKTFQKWKDNHKEEYAQARASSYSNLIDTAEKGLAKRLKGFKQKEVIKTFNIDEDGDKILVGEVHKTKDIVPDTLAIMFVLKAGNPEQWNYTEYKKLQLAEESGHEIKDIVEQLSKYQLKPPEEDSG